MQQGRAVGIIPTPAMTERVAMIIWHASKIWQRLSGLSGRARTGTPGLRGRAHAGVGAASAQRERVRVADAKPDPKKLELRT